MPLILDNIYDQGISHLNRWRERYEKKEYPNKIVVNIFYRNYTVLELWKELTPYFFKNNNPLNSIEKAYQNIYEAYQNKSKNIINPKLLTLIENDKDKDIGGVNYDAFKPIINDASNGDNKSVEQTEYVYLFQLLKNECILYWLSLGLCGEDYIDAFFKITGIQTGGIDPNLVDIILPKQELARGGLPFEMYIQYWMENNYKQMPNFW
ncbi:MAG TPA: hypothetical protein PLB59_01960 [Bacteroidales bacterium]|nr:hypothetical protein [Bacteroidales bacterium]HQP14707.1 hypothetical protein [Bacteroidales bacterium]